MKTKTPQEQDRSLMRMLRGRHGNPKTAAARERRLQRYEESPEFRLKCVLMARLRTFLKKRFGDKVKPDESWIGCSWPELREHIEKQFKRGMNWRTHGWKGWHIDHRISLFWAKTPEQAKILSNYRNLHPVSNLQNLWKGVSACPIFITDSTDPVLSEYMAANRL